MNKKQYTTPTLTVVTFKTERGYAQSSLSATKFRLNSLLGLVNPTVISTQEGWGDEVNLFGDDNNWDL